MTEPEEGTEDDRAGMAWWNAMDDHERKAWFDRISTGIPRDAWELFKVENPGYRRKS